MKVRIEVLKAPWPDNAKVGDTVEFKGDTIPAWAVGKCVQVADDAPVTGAKPAKKGE